jgi:hypothetical protein
MNSPAGSPTVGLGSARNSEITTPYRGIDWPKADEHHSRQSTGKPRNMPQFAIAVTADPRGKQQFFGGKKIRGYF